VQAERAAECAGAHPARARRYSLSADEKRDVFAQQAQFYSICARTLPRLARRLLHCLDQPDAAFDFIIWTEYTDDQVAQLALVLSILRQSPECVALPTTAG
jgi:hypothetical protein